MLSRLSVKKPFTVLVGVLIALALGGVSLTYMKTNLMPEFSIPYLMVLTTDVGASPEQVEADVTEVLEDELSTISGVENVMSSSMENYSMIFLEFADGTNMDSALVKVSAACNSVASELPETAGTPTYMEMSMDMMASMYLGVTDENRSLAQLTELAEDVIVPALERQEGVASVSIAGGVKNTVSIELNQDKIDLVNDGILGEANEQLSKAKDQLDQGANQIEAGYRQLDETEQQLNSSLEQIEEGQKALDAAKEQANAGLSQLETVNAVKAAYQAQLALLQTQLQMAQAQGESAEASRLQGQITLVQQALQGVEQQAGDLGSSSSAVLSLVEQQRQLDQGRSAVQQGLSSIASARSQLDASKAELEQGRKSWEEGRDSARKQANIDALLDISTLSQLIAAQNLEMPAGYIKGEGDDQWLVKVGERFTSAEQLEDLVLTRIDGVGDVTVGDVADVVVTDNVGESYANLNGKQGIVLSLTKSPTSNMGDVSKAVNKELANLEADYEGLDVIKVMDQGDYIDLYIWTMLKTLLLGALLAIVVLALFLRDLKPTLIVAFAIPFSVIFSLVVMYFTGLDLNIMTLGAMTIAIGMLVDNGIVVMENIYRLRQRGYAPARAAAQGARQVGGAVFASTLTTVCVFLPMVFTTGTVRQLLVPFALTLSYVLVASLLVALTVVPALGSALFKNMKPRNSEQLGRVQTAYGRALGWCLDHKAPVLVLAAALLGVSIFGVVRMGIVLMPEMSSNQLEMMLEMPEDMEKDEARSITDEAVARIAQIEGVADVGAIDNSFSASMMSSQVSAEDSYSGVFIVYVMVDESKVNTESAMKRLSQQAEEACSDLDCTVWTQDSMSDMSSMLSTGLTVEVRGTDNERVMDLAQDVIDVVETVEGYEEVTDGQDEADETLRVRFDKNKVARMGLTVAQLYQQLAADLSDSKTAFTMTGEDGEKMEVEVSDGDYSTLTRSKLMSWTFEDAQGKEHKLSSVATVSAEPGLLTVKRSNGAYVCNVTADIADGYNTTLLVRQLQPKLDAMDVPSDCTVEVRGTDETIADMLRQMMLLMALGFLLVYLVMVAQFQSLLSPFIIIFTV
ncbi:MAG: efflux RND transporter permease subunit, partial [Coriobacteriales bacterium]